MSESLNIIEFISVFGEQLQGAVTRYTGSALALGVPVTERVDTAGVGARVSGRGIAVTVAIIAPAPGLAILFLPLPQGALIPERIINPGASAPPDDLSELHRGAISELAEQAWIAASPRISTILGKKFKTGTPEAALNTIAGYIGGMPALTGISNYFVAEYPAKMDGADFSISLYIPEDFINALFAAPAAKRIPKPAAAAVSATKKIEAFAPPGVTAPEKPAPSRIMKKKQTSPAPAQKAKTPASKTERNLELLLDIPVTLTVELGRANVPGGKLLDLTPGSVVGLDTLHRGPIRVMVNEKNVALAEVVSVGEKFGVRIIQMLDPRKRLEEF